MAQTARHVAHLLLAHPVERDFDPAELIALKHRENSDFSALEQGNYLKHTYRFLQFPSMSHYRVFGYNERIWKHPYQTP